MEKQNLDEYDMFGKMLNKLSNSEKKWEELSKDEQKKCIMVGLDFFNIMVKYKEANNLLEELKKMKF
jgi:hypothetical protein